MVFIPYNNSIEINFYTSTNNRVPLIEFLDSLNNKNVKAKVFERLTFIRNNKSLLKEPFSRHLEEGIFELRIKFSNLNIRILYFYFENSLVITNGFLKKTNKTPRKEIEKAKRYRQNYINDKGGNYA